MKINRLPVTVSLIGPFGASDVKTLLARLKAPPGPMRQSGETSTAML